MNRRTRLKSESEITSLLQQVEDGKDSAIEMLIPLAHDQLRQIAEMQMRRERIDHTLGPTALINEVFLRLIGKSEIPNLANSSQFFSIAAESMRRILIDHSRKKNAIKRGGFLEKQPLAMERVVQKTAYSNADELLALDEALTELEKEDPEVAELVKLRFFAGLTVQQVAQQLDISPRTVNFRWAYARAWLKKRMNE